MLLNICLLNSCKMKVSKRSYGWVLQYELVVDYYGLNLLLYNTMRYLSNILLILCC